MDYIRYVFIVEDEDRATILYERALKVVSDPEELERRFRELTSPSAAAPS